MSCPECGSTRLYRDGFRQLSDGSSVQRWLCRQCGYRFSIGQAGNKGYKSVRQNCSHQLSVILREAKKLDSATETKTVAGELQSSQGKLVEFAWKMKKRGLASSTIENRTRYLSRLISKGAELLNVDSVETVLATEEWTPSNKRELVRSYKAFCNAFKIEWEPVKVNYEPRQPFIPLETEIDQLIAGCGKRTGTYLQVLKDTGARTGEVSKLKWTDVNSQNNTISINNPEKGSLGRTVKVQPKTIAMINAMPKKYGAYIFNPNWYSVRSSFYLTRRKLARTLQNPRINQIHFHTLRHWKATTEYAKTRDILHVKQLLGHKKLENTMIYTHMINFESDEWNSAAAQTLDEAKKLVEAGFDYVTEMDGFKLFRKRK
jgi:integrase